MARKWHRPEEVAAKLRQVEVLTARGKSVVEAIRSIGVTEVTVYRWRNVYGGLKGDQVRRLKELEAEDARLWRAASDLTLDKMILAEAAKGSAQAKRGRLWLADGSCIQLRPEHPNHVWPYDFIEDRTHQGGRCACSM